MRLTNTSPTSLLNDFDKIERYFVGNTDRLLKSWENMATVAQKINKTNYPPYNIKKIDDNRYVIEMAVAGFTKQDIELEFAENTLNVKGKLETMDDLLKDGVDQTYLYRGIADRAFTRQFTLADNVEIKNASLLNGMLKIWLEAIIPESKKPKKIDITESDE